MTEAHSQAAILNFRKAQSYYAEHNVYERYHISHIWIDALARYLNEFLNDDLFDLEPKRIIGFLYDNKALFDMSASHPQLPFALSWFEKLLDRKEWRIDSLPSSLQESDLFADFYCEQRHGRRLSSDFLWRVCMVERISHHLPVDSERLVVVELGSGSGNFARTFKLLYPNSTYICIDIPESLFFSNLFLTTNFDTTKTLYITQKDQVIENIFEYDFVFIPTEFASQLSGLHVDMFVNMNSLGEMTNDVIEHWINFIQETISCNIVFLLNRFLNRIDITLPSHLRLDESSCCLQLDQYWDILDWEVDPDFDRSPYVRTTASRNLLIIARRSKEPEALAQRSAKIVARLPAVALEDWAIQAYWDEDGLKSGGCYPALSSRGDLNLTHDLTASGPLFVLWEAFRLTRSQQSARLMLIWMMVHGGMTTPFEEIYFLGRAVDLSSAEGRLPEHLHQQLVCIPPRVTLIRQNVGAFNIIEIRGPFSTSNRYVAVPQSSGPFYYDQFIAGGYGVLLENSTIDEVVTQLRAAGHDVASALTQT